jgi:DNA-binding NarL/FixJ family response regulator
MPFSNAMCEFLAKEKKLSPRQKQIVSLLFKGCSDKQIAHQLDICVPTVRTHMSRLFAKVGASDRSELLIHFFKDARRMCKCPTCPLFN